MVMAMWIFSPVGVRMLSRDILFCILMMALNFAEHVVATNMCRTKQVRAADIDGDGDLDVLGMCSDDLIWYENYNNVDNFVPMRPTVISLIWI